MSSKHLITSRPLVFSPIVAKALGGTDEAVFVQQLQYWLNKAHNPAEQMDGWRDDEGNIWIYNTLDEWAIENFPHLNTQKIGRLIRKLEKLEVIETCQPFKKRYDNKKYYRINHTSLDAIIDPVQAEHDAIIEEHWRLKNKQKQTQVIDSLHDSNLNHRPFTFDISDSSKMNSLHTETTSSSSSYSQRDESPRPKYQSMNPDWMPSEELLDRIQRTKGIPAQFALDQVCEFVTYWLDNGKEQMSWDTKFIQSVIRGWEYHRANPPKAPAIPLPPRTQIPDNFALTPDLENTCQQIAPELINDVGNIFNRFVSYARDKGKTSHDWLSAWAAWLTREIEHHRKGDKYKTAHERKAEYHQRMMAANADTSWADGLGDFA